LFLPHDNNVAFINRLSNAAIIFSLLSGADAACPFAKKREDNRAQQQQNIHTTSHSAPRTLQSGRAGDGGVPTGGFDAVKKDIIDILTVSQDFFPADFGDTVGANYGPFMIRLAWHCSGSYRATDGRGGCDGGRIRYDPEINWKDNVSSHDEYFQHVLVVSLFVLWMCQTDLEPTPPKRPMIMTLDKPRQSFEDSRACKSKIWIRTILG